MDYNKLAACAPINKQAALATSEGEQWKPRVQMQAALKDMPDLKPPAPDERDLTGMTWGRLKVVGKAARRALGPSPRARWVARCSCGNFLTLKADTVLRQATDRCGECDYVRRLRDGLLKGMRNHPKPEAQ